MPDLEVEKNIRYFSYGWKAVPGKNVGAFYEIGKVFCQSAYDLIHVNLQAVVNSKRII